ncbi:MAG TPA: class D sortase [Thermoanaerobaculia bacterium]|nr:class D sortase [Thermoanaerobaculia bacterium]
MELSTNTARTRWFWAERALFAIGILCLLVYAWSWLDARITQARETRRLEEAFAKAPVVQSKASETDSFASLEQVQPEEPLEDGELVGRISIPRIGVSAIVLEGVGKRELRRGAGHIPATPRPEEEKGNVGIAAHRDSFFRGLKDIQEDDEIELTTLDGTFRYKVRWTKIVQPTDVSVLEPTEEPALTLVTCYPFYFVGSAPKRFIVRAHRIAEAAKVEPEEWMVDVDTE